MSKQYNICTDNYFDYRCSLNSECAEAEYVPLYWLSVTDHCIYLNAIEPQETLKTASQVVSLHFSNLPQLETKYFCDFKIFEKSYKMEATEINGVIECPTPPVPSLPNIVQGQHYYTSKLTVTTNIDWDVAVTNFTFYECDSLKTCTDCVSSKFPCSWCINSYTCIDNTEECQKDAFIEPISALNPKSVSGPNSCPRILKAGKSTEILIPSGNRERISVKIDGIKSYMKDKNFLCQFIIEEVVQKVKATLNGDLLSCEEVTFSLSSGNASTYANFSVLYDEDKLIDNPENILVLIYECSKMAQSCALCLELPEKYGCGWCQEDKESCQVHEHCNHTLMNLWLDQDYICPNPQIISFIPKSGPLDGGTNITINGINLGRHYYDIESNVRIVQGNGKEIAKCTTYEELYVKSTQIVCKVEKPLNFTDEKTKLRLDGFIEVGVLREYFARTKEQYSFVSSRIINVDPTKGPKSGGTILTIVGLHMDTGNKAKVFIGKQLCIVHSRDSGKIKCISPASKETNRQTIAVQFDSGTRISFSQKFEYVEDPIVIAVESSSSGQKDIPKGIPSGGIKITVKGKNFHTVPSHHIYIVVGEVEFNHTCELLSETEIMCPSPKVPIEKLNFVKDGTNTLPIQLEYGIRMDNVERVTNLSNRPGFSKFFMYPDPVVYSITENNGIIQYRGENLVIEGNNMNYVFQVSDIIVHIGTGYCNLTSLTPSRITCEPQSTIFADKNPNSDLYENELLEIVVEIGDGLNFTIGKMKYSSKETFTLGNPVLIGVTSSLVILILIILIILLYCYRKRMKNKESFVIHLENASKRLENPPDVWRKNMYGDEDAPQFVPARKYVRPKVNKITT